MQELTPSQLKQLALDINETIDNSNWSDAIATLACLNPLQAIYVFNVMKEEGLSETNATLVTLLGAKKMNDASYFLAVKALGEQLTTNN